jgi:putative endonuclease
VNQYYVYIMASQSGVLYTGVTNDLSRRVHEHKEGLIPGFTQKYKVCQLVYYETTNNVNAAIAREKQIKGWRREKKVKLVETINPGWDDLAHEVAPF